MYGDNIYSTFNLNILNLQLKKDVVLLNSNLSWVLFWLSLVALYSTQAWTKCNITDRSLSMLYFDSGFFIIP